MIIRSWILGSLFTVILAQHFVPIEKDSTSISPPLAQSRRRLHAHRKHTRREPSISSAEAAELRRLEDYEEKTEEYKEAAQNMKNEWYNQYFDRMRGYAVQTHMRRYSQMLAQQAKERQRFSQVMNKFGVREEDVLRETGGQARPTNERPKTPFGDIEDTAAITGKARAEAVPVLEAQRPSNVEPRPENREVHKKARALEALCAKFLPTVRKHCFGNDTKPDFVKRCYGYYHDCGALIPKADPLYSIAHAFNSGIGLNYYTVGVKGIPYYPINEEGAVEVGHQANIPFGSWGGGYSDNLGVRDYWSQTLEAGGNWYEGKYGVKTGWSVPLVQSLGVEGESHALVSVPTKPGELGKPIGVDVGGGVGPYYQGNQHVGVDYLNGQVNTNLGVGVPMAGVGVNTGLGISFPSATDIMG